ncbi:MAG: DUF1801 domain-containing protein [Cyclobacteriaceae bacterium]
MSDMKTKPNEQDVGAFLNAVDNERRRKDALYLLDMMKEVTGDQPKMWGDTIVGFGSYHYKYATGREGDWFITGFSPRKQNMSVYIMPGFDKYPELMSKLGKHKTGVSCLYINKLEDVDLDVLRELVERSFRYMDETYNAKGN